MKFTTLLSGIAASSDLLTDLLTVTKALSTKVNERSDEALREATKTWITDGFQLYSDRETSTIKEIKSAISGNIKNRNIPNSKFDSSLNFAIIYSQHKKHK